MKSALLTTFYCVVIFAFVSSDAVSKDWSPQQTDSHIQDSSKFNLEKFWRSPSGKALAACGKPTHKRLKKSIRFSVHAERTKDNNLIKFADYFGRVVSYGLALDNKKTQEAKSIVLDIASNRYFQKPVMNDGWSPIYVQSNIIRLSALFLSHLRRTEQISSPEEQVIIDWIEPMLKYQKGRKQNGSDDSRAASGVALIAWGSVTEDHQLVERGIKQWKESLPYTIGSIGRLKRQKAHLKVPKSALSLADEFNLTLAHVIEGYVMLENIGFDLSKVTFKDQSVLDAIDWWIDRMNANDIEDFRGFTRKGVHNWHVAWLPIYLSNERSIERSKKADKLVYDFIYGSPPFFSGVSLGNYTDCLWSFFPEHLMPKG